MKLDLAMQGRNANVDLMELYGQVSDTLPFTLWNKYLSLALARELDPAKRESISLQLKLTKVALPHVVLALQDYRPQP